MADEPIEELAEHGRRPVPAVDPAFADRLESSLRVVHAATSQARRRPATAWLPRVGVAVAVLVVMLVGAVALTDRDAGVPVSVIDADSSPPADFAAPPADGAGGAERPADEPDPVVSVPTPTPTPTPAATSDGVADATPAAMADEDRPAASVVTDPDDATASQASPTATSEPRPSPTEAPDATAEPAATATSETTPVPPTPQRPSTTPTPLRPIPAATATPSRPTATPTPTVEPEPALISATCAARIVGDEAGVTCSWRTPTPDRPFTRYEVLRSRNGAEARVVAEQRPTTSEFVDRNVAIGDEVVYVIRALDAQDRIVAASGRQAVSVAASG